MITNWEGINVPICQQYPFKYRPLRCFNTLMFEPAACMFHSNIRAIKLERSNIGASFQCLNADWRLMVTEVHLFRLPRRHEFVRLYAPLQTGYLTLPKSLNTKICEKKIFIGGAMAFLNRIFTANFI